MMSFCKKSVHSFLGLTANPMMKLDAQIVYNNFEKPPCSSKCHGPANGGIGLMTATGDVHRTPNVLESSSVKSSSASPSSSPPPSSVDVMAKKDPGGIGFIDDIGGGVDGLMSCTESLGFESSDERRVDDEIELCSRTRPAASKANHRKVGERREAKRFPPPLPSLNHNGQPSFYLRPVRRDGRLELSEVWLDRPEILRASRQDGRLRLHLVRDEDFNMDEEEEQEHQEHQLMTAEDKNEEEMKEEEKIDEGEEEEEEEEEEGRVEEWRFPAVAGEGYRRCHEVLNHHHHSHHHNRDHHHHHHHHSNYHHNLHVWSQHCVTTR